VSDSGFFDTEGASVGFSARESLVEHKEKSREGNKKTKKAGSLRPAIRTEKSLPPRDSFTYTTMELHSRLVSYCLLPPNAPRRQERQMPNPLPLAWMKPHNVVARASSAALSVAGVKATRLLSNTPVLVF
jgi:hypothetical protein